MPFSLITHTAASGSGVNTPAVNTTGSKIIVAGVSYIQSADPVVADSAGNTWTKIANIAMVGTSQISLFASFAPVTSSTHTFKATAADAAIFVQAFSASFSALLDQQNNNATSTSTIQPGSVTPSYGNELIVSIAGDAASLGTTLNSVNSSFTITDKVASASATNASGLAYLIQTAATTENPTFTFSSSNNAAAIIATFKLVIPRSFGVVIA